MHTSKEIKDPLEIEAPAENGSLTSTYVIDISEQMLDGEVCSAIALALADILECDPAQMTPLSNVVDCDALQLLFHTRRYGDLRDDVSVSFPYDVYEVTVYASGRLVVQG